MRVSFIALHSLVTYQIYCFSFGQRMDNYHLKDQCQPHWFRNQCFPSHRSRKEPDCHLDSRSHRWRGNPAQGKVEFPYFSWKKKKKKESLWISVDSTTPVLRANSILMLSETRICDCNNNTHSERIGYVWAELNEHVSSRGAYSKRVMSPAVETYPCGIDCTSIQDDHMVKLVVAMIQGILLQAELWNTEKRFASCVLQSRAFAKQGGFDSTCWTHLWNALWLSCLWELLFAKNIWPIVDNCLDNQGWQTRLELWTGMHRMATLCKEKVSFFVCWLWLNVRAKGLVRGLFVTSDHLTFRIKHAESLRVDLTVCYERDSCSVRFGVNFLGVGHDADAARCSSPVVDPLDFHPVPVLAAGVSTVLQSEVQVGELELDYLHGSTGMMTTPDPTSGFFFWETLKKDCSARWARFESQIYDTSTFANLICQTYLGQMPPLRNEAHWRKRWAGCSGPMTSAHLECQMIRNHFTASSRLPCTDKLWHSRRSSRGVHSFEANWATQILLLDLLMFLHNLKHKMELRKSNARWFYNSEWFQGRFEIVWFSFARIIPKVRHTHPTLVSSRNDEPPEDLDCTTLRHHFRFLNSEYTSRLESGQE